NDPCPYFLPMPRRSSSVQCEYCSLLCTCNASKAWTRSRHRNRRHGAVRELLMITGFEPWIVLSFMHLQPDPGTYELPISVRLSYEISNRTPKSQSTKLCITSMADAMMPIAFQVDRRSLLQIAEASKAMLPYCIAIALLAAGCRGPSSAPSDIRSPPLPGVK